MKRYDTPEAEFRGEFKSLMKSIYWIIISVNIAVGFLSYLANTWMWLVGSLFSSFFILLSLIGVIGNALRYFVERYKNK